MQAGGLPLSWIFFGLAVASFGAVWFVFGKWGKEGVRDFGALLFSALFRVELRGLENLPPAGTRMMIAPNHVSLLDGPLLHAVLPIDAGFAVDTGIAKAWWAKPFMKMIRLHDRPDQAAGGARPDQAGGRGRAARDLPGRAHHGHRLADEGL